MGHWLMAMLFSFKFRLARGPFWWSCVGTGAAYAILFVFLEDSLGRSATWILYPPLLWILAALIVKRLHDRRHTAAGLLWLPLPVLGPLWLIVNLGFRKGQRPSAMRWGSRIPCFPRTPSPAVPA